MISLCGLFGSVCSSDEQGAQMLAVLAALAVLCGSVGGGIALGFRRHWISTLSSIAIVGVVASTIGRLALSIERAALARDLVGQDFLPGARPEPVHWEAPSMLFVGPVVVVLLAVVVRRRGPRHAFPVVEQ